MTSITARIEGLARRRASVTALSAVKGADAVHAVFRIGVGLLFLQHGLQKVFGMLGGFMGTPGATAPIYSLVGLAGVLELVGGILLVAGLLTRPVAFVLAGEMIVAFFMAHFPQGGWPVQNGGELPLLYALIFTFLLWNGAGSVSVDRVLEKAGTPRGA